MRQLTAVIAAYQAIEEIDDRREPFGLEKHEAAKFRDGRFLGFGKNASRDDQYWNVAELRYLTEIFQNVEAGEPVGQAHIEHSCHDRGRPQQLDCAIDGFGLDARISRISQESTRRMPDEWLVVQDENGRCVRGVGSWMHGAAYVR